MILFQLPFPKTFAAVPGAQYFPEEPPEELAPF
jgi:hypothetical protein